MYELICIVQAAWIGTSQLEAGQPIRASFSETTEAVYRPIPRGNSASVELTKSDCPTTPEVRQTVSPSPMA